MWKLDNTIKETKDMNIDINSMNVIIVLCHSFNRKLLPFKSLFLLVNASFRRHHLSFVRLLLATAPII